MAPYTKVLQDIQKHLALVDFSEGSTSNNAGFTAEQLQSIPLFSSAVRQALDAASLNASNNGAVDVLPQYGLMGMCLETYGKAPPREGANGTTKQDDDDNACNEKQQHPKKEDSLVYANINAPWSAFICGSQGSGKSHTLSCMLENSLVAPSNAGVLTAPLTGLVLHYDKFTGIETGQLCEAAYLCSSGIPVKILVSPSNFSRMEKLYSNLPGLGKGVKPPQVVPMKFPEKKLTIGMMKSLMAVGDGSPPLYMEVVTKVLRDMAEGGNQFNFMDFKYRLDNAGLVQGQLGPLNMRLQLLESFLDLPSGGRGQPSPWSRGGKFTAASHAKPKNSSWEFEEGSLNIIDLSCPFVDENDACALFNICLGMFLEDRGKGGRVVALDEAHKFLATQSREASILTETMLSIIRQQRHLATRVIIATQEPTLSPSLLDLCNVTIVHRFNSPAWFKMLKDHLAGAVIGLSESKAPAYSADNIFSKIVCLRTGEALVFSPSAILEVESHSRAGTPAGPSSDSNEEVSGSERESQAGSSVSKEVETEERSSPSSTLGLEDLDMRELGPRYIKMRIRQRITADGGRSILGQ